MTRSGLTLDVRYRLEERIAAGGVGQVWRGRDLLLQRPVAIKLLRPDGGPDASPYLVMELVNGPSLADVLAAGAVSAARALNIVAQAAAGLAAAHRTGLVHRGIKPGNILLSPDGLVKITDFGIAHAAGTAPVTLLAGVCCLLASGPLRVTTRPGQAAPGPATRLPGPSRGAAGEPGRAGEPTAAPGPSPGPSRNTGPTRNGRPSQNASAGQDASAGQGGRPARQVGADTANTPKPTETPSSGSTGSDSGVQLRLPGTGIGISLNL